ncbi:LysM domain-containing protein [Ophiocordyceps camponoti-floridani]|uniref:LysM domain-containing protein n=1 Tax=Ophiocordyceps camponoti-floridani TaxID=2030778 RepID=A0A8H4Q5V5_9HYPO|nr:LysM domain-containing protein [Ophiocordyceps camponoti-floridani]
MASPLRRLLLLLGGYSVFAAAVPPMPTTETLCYYVVEGGDDCNLIATSHDLTVREFLEMNSELGSNCSISINDSVIVPCFKPKKPTPETDRPCTSIYLVTEGDTCHSIAISQGVSPRNLIAWNLIDDDCNLRGYLKFSTSRNTSTPNINISQELKSRLRLICSRYVGNYTKSEPIPDSVLLPSDSQMEKMIMEAAKVKSEGLQVYGGNTVEAVASASGPKNIVLNQLFKLMISDSVDIRSSSCDTGSCSLQVSSSATADIEAPAAVGSKLELPQSDGPATASDKAEKAYESQNEGLLEEGSC